MRLHHSTYLKFPPNMWTHPTSYVYNAAQVPGFGVFPRLGVYQDSMLSSVILPRRERECALSGKFSRQREGRHTCRRARWPVRLGVPRLGMCSMDSLEHGIGCLTVSLNAKTYRRNRLLQSFCHRWRQSTAGVTSHPATKLPAKAGRTASCNATAIRGSAMKFK